MSKATEEIGRRLPRLATNRNLDLGVLLAALQVRPDVATIVPSDHDRGIDLHRLAPVEDLHHRTAQLLAPFSDEAQLSL